MLRVFADNHDFAFSLYDFAFIAYLFNGWFNLHFYYTIPFLIFSFALLFRTPSYAALSKVVNRHLYGNLITRQYSYIVHSKLTRDMSCYYMLIRKLYLEGRVGQCLNYCTFKFDHIVLWQNNPSSAFICDLLLIIQLLPLFINKGKYHNTLARKSYCVFIVC